MGVFDVIPANSLEGLTSEDFRLLLNGVGSINVQTLISYTSFNDESGEYWTLADLLLLYLLGFEQNLVSNQVNLSLSINSGFQSSRLDSFQLNSNKQ